MTIRELQVFCGGLTLALTTACGAAPDPNEAAAPEPVASVTERIQPVDQTNCGGVTPDVVAEQGEVDSPDTTYDHPGCPNSFVVEYPHVAETTTGKGANFSVWYPPSSHPTSLFDLFFCGLNWVEASVWQKQGTSFVLIAKQTGHAKVSGTPYAPFPGLECAPVTLDFDIPAPGDYKIAASAGMQGGAKTRVFVDYFPNDYP
jgi:hypothetical protein